MKVASERSATARLVRSAALTLLFVTVGITAAGWTYWERHPLLAVPNVAVAAALAVAGVLLRAQRSSRRCGTTLAAAGVCCALAWLISWDVGVLPLVGSLGQSAFWLCYGWSLLCYPGNSPRGRPDRWWVGFAAVTLLAGQVLTVLISRPEWNGFSPDVRWPAPLLLDRAGFEAAMYVLTVLYVLVPVTFLLLVLARMRRARGLDRTVVGPVLLAAGVTALVAAVTYPPLMSGPSLEQLLDAVALQGATSFLAPGALLAMSVRGRLLVTTTADRLRARIGSPTPGSARAALRAELRDDALEVYYYQPSLLGFVGPEGRPVDVPPTGVPADWFGAASDGVVRGGLWYEPVFSARGTLVAVLGLHPALRHHRPRVDAARAAAAAALEHAGAQARLRAQLLRLGDERRRASHTWSRECEVVERELGDRARTLADLAATATAAEGATRDPATARSLAQIADGLRAAHGELAAITDGLRPVPAERAGLRRVLEELTATLRHPSQLRVASGSFDPASEQAMYLALAAALRHPAHAEGPAIRIEVLATDGMLVGEVTTPAPGAQAPDERAADEPVAGGADLLRALGGSVAVRRDGDGTTTRIMVPCG